MSFLSTLKLPLAKDHHGWVGPKLVIAFMWVRATLRLWRWPAVSLGLGKGRESQLRFHTYI